MMFVEPEAGAARFGFVLGKLGVELGFAAI